MAKKIEDYIEKRNDFLVQQLKELFDAPVFENRVTEREEKKLREGKKIRDFFIYRTGDMRPPTEEGNKLSISQDVIIVYISEMSADLDVRALKIIGALDNQQTYQFRTMRKSTAQKGSTDGVVDVLEFSFTRMLKYGC